MIVLGRKIVNSLNDAGLFVFQIVLAIWYGGILLHTINNPDLYMIIMSVVLAVIMGCSVVNFIRFWKANANAAYERGRRDGLIEAKNSLDDDF